MAGVTNINLPEAELKRKMLAAARRRIVVADSSKIGHVDLAWLCSTADIDELLTGTTADATTVAALRDGGLSVREVGG